MDQAIDHNELDESLKRCGSSWNAGQVHGLLCSRLAIAGADGVSLWASQVLADTNPEDAQRGECEAMLDILCAATRRQLVERQSEFMLLLPEDGDPADMRATAMGYWCEGFLHGLVAEKHTEDLRSRLAAEPLADIIKDMLEITRATVGDGAGDEDTESAYVELVEYLRVAVQLTYEELAEFRTPAEATLPDESDTLH
jgi:uncharacterized protein YgfB (UPF0149 family)